MSLKTTVDNYKLAEQLHKDIDEAFNMLDQDDTQQSEKILSDIRRLELTLNKINIEDLKEKYSPEVIDDVQHNVDFFFEAADYIKKYLFGRKYYDLIIGPVTNYINQIYYGRGDKKALARKFAAMLTHRDNIMTFMNHIKRIAVGTMSEAEFRKIFNTNKHKIIGGMDAFESFEKFTENEKATLIKEMKILTLDDYKNLNEDFFNPFDEITPDTTPKLMADKGGMLKTRREVFNINRVEYTKRTNGQYTVIAKDMIAKGEIVEICPVMMCGIEAKAIDGVKDLIFEIDRNNQQYGLVLGYGSIYQHSENPNMEFGYNKSNKQMYFTSLRMIKTGEELTINYGKEYWDERKSFNTLAPLPQPDKIAPENESMGLQQPAADITGTMRTAQFGSPTNPANPAISGVAIKGAGQS